MGERARGGVAVDQRRGLGGTPGAVVAAAMREPTAEEVIEWVRASTAAQGVPERVTDAAVIEAVSTLLRDGREPVTSKAPHGHKPRRVERVAALDGGVNDNVVEDGANDGGLPSEG